jgi:hypothetical protein
VGEILKQVQDDRSRKFQIFLFGNYLDIGAWLLEFKAIA